MPEKTSRRNLPTSSDEDEASPGSIKPDTTCHKENNPLNTASTLFNSDLRPTFTRTASNTCYGFNDTSLAKPGSKLASGRVTEQVSITLSNVFQLDCAQNSGGKYFLEKSQSCV